MWTVLSDIVHGEVIGLRQDRSEAAATALLTEELTGRQRAAITAACTDMHRPYLNAVATGLPHAESVLDKFHVLQHASAALDECGVRNSSGPRVSTIQEPSLQLDGFPQACRKSDGGFVEVRFRVIACDRVQVTPTHVR